MTNWQAGKRHRRGLDGYARWLTAQYSPQPDGRSTAWVAGVPGLIRLVEPDPPDVAQPFIRNAGRQHGAPRRGRAGLPAR